MHLATAPRALITPEGIRWRNRTPEIVEIEIDVTNPHDESLDTGKLVIEAAPFGAFLPWRPLTTVDVAPLGPRERTRVRVAVATDDLPPDEVELEWSHQNWVGNIAVWFDGNPEGTVERHCAFDLVVPPKSSSVILLEVHHLGKYAYHVQRSNPLWAAEVLSNESRRDELERLARDEEELAEVVDSDLMALDQVRSLRVIAPDGPSQTDVGVRVTRESDGREVLVELHFATSSGESTRLGCVTA